MSRTKHHRDSKPAPVRDGWHRKHLLDAVTLRESLDEELRLRAHKAREEHVLWSDELEDHEPGMACLIAQLDAEAEANLG